MKVNRTNYESYLIDLLEGNLSHKQEEELFAFLKNNPELNEEYELLKGGGFNKLLPVSEEKIDFGFLKKSENILIHEEEMVASLEGDLSAEEEKKLQEKLLLYPSFQKDMQLFQMTKLPMEHLVFKGKDKLRKKNAILIPLYFRVGAIAAVFIAIAFASLLYFDLNTIEDQPLANLMKVKEQPSYSSQHLLNQPLKEKSISKSRQEAHQMASGSEQVLAMENRPSSVNELSPRGLYKIGTESKPEVEKLNPVNIRIAATLPPQNTEVAYMNPGEWLMQKFKGQLPEKAVLITDSLVEEIQTSPTDLALNLVQKTTGITYQEKKDEAGESKSFSIVTRYFAYERIVHY